MRLDVDPPRSHAMRITRTIPHFCDRSQNLLQSGKQTVDSMISVRILVHVIETLHLIVLVPDLAGLFRRLTTFLNDTAEDLFQKGSGLCECTVKVAFLNIFLRTF